MNDSGLSEHARKMDILRATRGRLASDTYSFEQSLSIDDNNILRSSFFIHGMHHQELPDDWSIEIKEQNALDLVQEPDNDYDPFAVAVYTGTGNRLSYIPAFYSNAIFTLIENGLSPSIQVVYVNEKTHRNC